jgi:hypothetical protein
MLKFVGVLLSKYVLPLSDKGDGSSSKVLGSIMEFLLLCSGCSSYYVSPFCAKCLNFSSAGENRIVPVEEAEPDKVSDQSSLFSEKITLP